MPHPDSVYILLSFISSIVLLIYGIHLLASYVPRRKELRPYLVSRRTLAAAYFVLAIPPLYEVLAGDAMGNTDLAGGLTLAVAAYQAFLFTATLLVLTGPGFVTVRRMAVHLGVITAAGGWLLTALFCLPAAAYRVVYWLCLAAYIGQMAYYIGMFREKHRKCLQRLADFYDEDEERRLVWIGRYFYLSLAVGGSAVFAGMLPKVYFSLFIVVSTLYYAYFGIRHCDYGILFSDVPLTVMAPPATPSPNPSPNPSPVADTVSPPGNSLDEKVEQWIKEKKYTRTGVSMSDVAEELGTNRSYFSHYLNSQKHTNFRNWRTRLKIEEASRLLLIYHDKSLSEIAETVGISDTSNFRKHFIEIMGVTPQEWRGKGKGLL